MAGWIGVDLDGTLAKYDKWEGPYVIGDPIPRMVQRVKNWLAQGIEVRIVTARVSQDENTVEDRRVRIAIAAWSLNHIGQTLPMTCVKDYQMEVLYDDRCVQVERNTGRLITDGSKE